MRLRPSICLEPLEARQLLTTYYVATNGDDNFAGSSAAPFRSLQEGVSHLLPGDTLNIRAGSYGGFVLGWDGDGLYGPLNGTANAPIVIQADPAAAAGSVIINSQNNKTNHGIDLESGNSWVTMKGLTIINPGNDALNGDGIRVTTSNNISILNCTVTGALRFGIFCSFTTNFLVQGNTVVNNPGTGDPATGHGIYVSNSAVNPVIRGNLVSGNGSQGIHFNGDVSAGGIGMITGALVENNVIGNNINNGINADGLTNSRIQNNLIYGSTKHGISLYHIDAAAGSTGNLIINNTIYSPLSEGAAIQIVSGSTGNILFNNVLIGGDYGAINISADSATGFLSDYNAVADRFLSDDTGTFYTLAEWRAAAGLDLHSVNITPSQNFTNIAANDFYPRNGAPIVNAGIASFAGIAVPIADFAGHARLADARPDIGAYEFGSNNRPNTNPLGYIDVAGPKTLRGWVADFDMTDASLAVRLDVDGAAYASTTANGTRTDLIHLVGSANHGYVFDLSAFAPGLHRVDLYATDADTGQAVLFASRVISTNTPPTGWLDVLNNSLIAGWAADANAGAAAVQIRFVIDSNAPVVVTANRTRSDLSTLLGSTDHGFVASIPQLTAGLHAISIYAIDSTTFDAVLIASRTLSIASPAGNALPTGYVEVATATRVSGWAMDMTTKGASVNVRVDVHGVAGTPFLASLVRKDVNTVMKVAGNFGFSKALTLSAGQHRVDVYALDTTTGLATLLASRIVSSSALLGSIDVLTPTAIAGWAYSPALAGGPATVRIDVDGLAGGTTLANISRSDLVSYLGSDKFGFSATLPALTPGKHTIALCILDPLTLMMTKLVTAAVIA